MVFEQLIYKEIILKPKSYSEMNEEKTKRSCFTQKFDIVKESYTCKNKQIFFESLKNIKTDSENHVCEN